MTIKVFLNLPVKDLERSKQFLQGFGCMFQHSFADLDGHKWEMAYVDLSQFPQI